VPVPERPQSPPQRRRSTGGRRGTTSFLGARARISFHASSVTSACACVTATAIGERCRSVRAIRPPNAGSGSTEANQ
jgi:hypothetical protein